jgi:hypothetical protein
MAATYDPIASTTLVSESGIISFDNIAANWTDLMLVVNHGAVSAGPTIRVRFNDDSASNYSYTYVSGESSAVSSRISSASSGAFGLTTAGSSTLLDNIVIAHIMSYANTNIYKTCLGSGASPTKEVDRVVTLWRSTSAITKLSISPGGIFPTYNFIAGTTASLYGIKAA